MGVNKVILLGRLGKDPELRYSSQQLPIASFSLATGERRKDQSGNWGEHTEWHNIVCFGKQAENCANYLKKGSEVYIDGRIQTRKWQDKEGKDRWSTEIVANSVQFVGAKGGGSGDYSSSGPASTSDPTTTSDPTMGLQSADKIAANGGSKAGPSSAEVTFEDDDIPF